MDNEKILTDRWKDIDDYLLKYLKEYNKIDKKTINNLQDMLDTIDVKYEDLNKIVPSSKKKRIDSKIQDMLNEKENDNSYFFFFLFGILNKKNITYRELIEAMIYISLYDKRTQLDEYENWFFEQIIKESYDIAIEDIKPLIKPQKKLVLFSDDILYVILNIPLLYGTRQAYMESLELLNAQELTKKVVSSVQHESKIDLMQGLYKTFFEKCRNKYICINDDKHSGTIENLTETYSNLAYVEAGKQNDIRKCRFIAEMDKRTTKMCESLNNQIFYLDKVNTYQRYSDYDKRIVTYTTKGLVVGENLPPISNHFHWCRSTITYLIDNEKEIEHIRDSIKIANESDKEQYSRYKKYYDSDEIPDNVEDFVKMKYNNPDEWNHLKVHYQDRKLRYRIRNEYNLKVNEENFNKHKPGTYEYIQRSKKEQYPSEIYLTLEEEQALINDFAGYGVFRRNMKTGTFKNAEEHDFLIVVGKMYSKKLKKYVETTKGTIHYSEKKGTHIVPRIEGDDV